MRHETRARQSFPSSPPAPLAGSVASLDLDSGHDVEGEFAIALYDMLDGETRC